MQLTTLRYFFPLLLFSSLGLFAGGCASLPRTIDQETLLQHAEARTDALQAGAARMVATMAQRMAAKASAMEDPNAAVEMNVLVLSGGGEYGAFGAGFLNGWGALGDGPLARPEFDIVTGISTGALIAPFALLGDETSYAEVLSLYEEATPEFAVLRGLFFFLPRNPAFLDNHKLADTLRVTVDPLLLAQVAEAYEAHRLLLIGTTDIDLGQFVVWDLGYEITTHGEPEQRFEKVLLASSAIPAVFPPVYLDGHLHVDGGATEQLFLATDYRAMEAAVMQARRLGLGDRSVNFRYWIIMNNQLGLQPEVVRPSWFRIAERSLSMLMKASGLSALQRGQQVTDILNARDNGITSEFRYIGMPQDLELPQSRSLFNPELMKMLADLGYEMGADRRSWRTDAPRHILPVHVE